MGDLRKATFKYMGEIKWLVIGLGVETSNSLLVGGKKMIELPQELKDKVSELVESYFNQDEIDNLLNNATDIKY